MSGGYEIGPDGVSCAPPSMRPPPTPNQNYPKKPKKTPKEEQNSPPNTSSDTLAYAWNTGDTQLFENVSDPNDSFRNKLYLT